MGLTAWAEEQQAKHQAWREIEDLKRQNAALVADNERLKALAVAGADLAIDVANTGIQATKRSDELQAQNERLVAERDALVAENAIFRSLLEMARDEFIEAHSDGETDCVTPYDVYHVGPEQCLNEIRAEAITDAIDAHKNNVMTFGFDSAIRVTDLIRYAAKVREGGAE